MDYAEGGIIIDSMQLSFGVKPKEFDLSLSTEELLLAFLRDL